ncbi:MAG: MFS transporter [Deltaproteobacteria bacterium]|nr:MFS transporter [Deltaproteobacteria bacterium]
MSRLLRWLGMQPGELARTGWMFCYLLLTVGAFISGRITRDALFLNRYDIEYLPYMYVWVAVAMSAVAYLYSRFADRFRRDRLVLAVTAVLLAGVLIARVLTTTAGVWFYPVLYVYVELMGGLSMILFWTFANDVFTTREAKRLFGLVGAGGVVATVLAGFTISGISERIGTINLLWLCAGLLAGCMALVIVLSRISRTRLEQAAAGFRAPRTISLGADWIRLLGNPQLKVIALMTMLAFVTVTIVDYQFKFIARNTFLNREDQLAAFFGLFYGAAGALSIFIQLLLTGRVLQRFGVVAALTILPLALGGGTSLLLIAPGILTASLLKGTDNVLRYTIHDASTQLLYLPIPGHLRGRAKAFIEGILKPLAQGLTGLVIAWSAWLVGHRVDWLGFGSFFFLVAWITLIVGLKKDYLHALAASLRRRETRLGRAAAPASGPGGVAALQRTLADEDEQNVLDAMEILPFAQRHDWSKQLAGLLDHRSPQVRMQAVRLLEREDPISFLDRVLMLFDDPDHGVRAEAVNFYCGVLKEKSMPAVLPLLRDGSSRVRASAVAGLIEYGGLDGIILASQSLREMLASADAGDRRAAAWAIGRARLPTLYRSLLPLLEDPQPQVRVEAVRAAGELESPELVLSLIHRLLDPHSCRAAVSALAAYGPSLLKTLRTILGNPREQPEIREAIPRVLARIGDQLSMDILSRVLETATTALRAQALEAILQLHLRYPKLTRDRGMLRRVLHRELKQAFQFLAISIDVRPLEAPLLEESIRHRYQQCIDRIFKLLMVLYPGQNMEVVHRNLANPIDSIRANALELLEQSVDDETRRCLLPLLEEHDPASLASRGDALFPLLHHKPFDWLYELLLGEHVWTTACCLDVIRRLGDRRFEPHVRMLLDSDKALVREMAVFCLGELSRGDDLSQALAPLAADPDPRVRQAARGLCAT